MMLTKDIIRLNDRSTKEKENETEHRRQNS